MMSPAESRIGASPISAAPAAASRDHVIGDEMLGCRERLADDRSARRRFGHPRLRGVDVEEDGAGQAHRPQHIRQRIHRHPPRTIEHAHRTLEHADRDPDDRQRRSDARSFDCPSPHSGVVRPRVFTMRRAPMPLFMDVHDHIEGLTADAVGHAHAGDLEDAGEVRRQVPCATGSTKAPARSSAWSTRRTKKPPSRCIAKRTGWWPIDLIEVKEGA